MTYHILGIGHACIDLIIPVSEEFLKTIPGDKGGARAISLQEFDGILARNPSLPCIQAGGSCANTIKGLANLGEKCAFISHIGSDSFGKQFTKHMKQLKIETLFSSSPLPTARVLCFITPDQERTMRFYPGCSEESSTLFLNSDHFKNVKLTHFDAYTMRNDTIVERGMQLAKEAGSFISFDVSSFEIIHQFHTRILSLLLNFVDIVFANEKETEALTGLDPLQGCMKLQEMCSIVVVLLGSKGCLVGCQGDVFFSPAFPAKAVDSTGAGDLFASGFLYGYLQNYPLEKCAALGNLLGGAIVEVQGAELPQEKWQQLKKDFFH